MATENKNDGLVGQCVKFGITGTIGAAIWYGGFYILFKFCSAHHVAASLVAASAATVFAFITNRRWTFNVKGKGASRQFIKYVTLVSLAIASSALTLYVCTDMMGIMAEISQVIAMGVSTVINFLGSKLWVFRSGVLECEAA